MKKYLAITTALIAFTGLYASAGSAVAQIGVGINIGVPGVYVQERPAYVRPEYESDWRERQERAHRWHEEQVRDHHDDHRDYDHDRDHDDHRRD